MATYYVDNGASGANDGTSWTDAWASIESYTAATNGDIVYVDKTHTESKASDITITGSVTGMVYFYSVTNTGSVPTQSDLAVMTSLGIVTTSVGHIIVSNGCYIWGLYLHADQDLKNLGTQPEWLENCVIEVGFDDQVQVNISDTSFYFKDCTFKSDGANSGDDQYLLQVTANHGDLIVDGCDFNDTSLQYRKSIITATRSLAKAQIKNSDFSSYGVSAATVTAIASSTIGLIEIENCKLPTNSNFSTGTAGSNALKHLSVQSNTLRIYNSSSGSDQENDQILSLRGTLDTWGAGMASRAVYRTGGFTRKDQANPQCWRIDIDGTYCFPGRPFEIFPIYTYYSTTGSTITVTLEYLLGDASATDDLDYAQMWMDVSYYDDAGSLTRMESNKEQNIGTLTSHATSTVGWTTTDAESSTAKRKMTLTTSGTIAQEGWVTAIITVASIGTNDSIYIDPMLTIA